MPNPSRTIPLIPIACGCLVLGPLSIVGVDSFFKSLRPKSESALSAASPAGGLLSRGVGLISDLGTLAPSPELFAPSGGGMPSDLSKIEKEFADFAEMQAQAKARGPNAPLLLTPPPKGADGPTPTPSATGSPTTGSPALAAASSSASDPLTRARETTWVMLLQINSERRRVFSELPEDDTVASLAAIREYHDFKIAKFEEIARLHHGFARKFVDGLIVNYRAQKVMQVAFLEAQAEWLNVLIYERKPTRDELARRIEIAEALVAATQEYHTWSENLPGRLDRIDSESLEDSETAEMLQRVVVSFKEENEAQVALLNVNYDIAQTSVRMLKFLRMNYNDWTVAGTLPTFDEEKLESQFDDLMTTLKNHLDVASELEAAGLRRAKS